MEKAPLAAKEAFDRKNCCRILSQDLSQNLLHRLLHNRAQPAWGFGMRLFDVHAFLQASFFCRKWAFEGVFPAGFSGVWRVRKGVLKKSICFAPCSIYDK